MVKLFFSQDMKDKTAEKITVIEKIDRTIKNINQNANVDLALDKLMIELCLI